MVDSTASLRTVSKTVHNNAVTSTVRGHSGSRIARLTYSRRTALLVSAWSVRGVRGVAAADG
eukprot:2553342-Lingulodinium_polyedra.AAC.1